MQSVMCRKCGYFVRAIEIDGELEPSRKRCPMCGEDEFVDVRDR